MDDGPGGDLLPSPAPTTSTARQQQTAPEFQDLTGNESQSTPSAPKIQDLTGDEPQSTPSAPIVWLDWSRWGYTAQISLATHAPYFLECAFLHPSVIEAVEWQYKSLNDFTAVNSMSKDFMMTSTEIIDKLLQPAVAGKDDSCKLDDALMMGGLAALWLRSEDPGFTGPK